MTAIDELAAVIRHRLEHHDGTLFVGLDGRSGVGKSTLAAAVMVVLGDDEPPIEVVVLDGDGFYAGGTAARWDRRTAAEKADQVIDRRRQRAVLQGLRRWGVATWHPFDWESEDWDRDPAPCTDTPITVESARVVVLEGAHSCHPELHDLLDLRVFADAPTDVRRARLLAREGEDYRADWEARWSEAEDHYFGTVMPPDRFDLVVTTA